MSNTLINWRFGSWHFKVQRDSPYIVISRNAYHDKLRKNNPDWKWFERY